MKPVLALVGRPNVGKSTLFNRLTRSRDALVSDVPGLTRDRKYGEGSLGEVPYIVIDTGGLDGGEEGLDGEMASQSLLAIDEADAVLLMVDGRAGLMPGDEQILQYLRKSRKSAFLVVNKVDGLDEDVASSDFYRLGVDSLFAVSASQGRGVRKLINGVLADFPDAGTEAREPPADEGIRIAISGRTQSRRSALSGMPIAKAPKPIINSSPACVPALPHGS